MFYFILILIIGLSYLAFKSKEKNFIMPLSFLSFFFLHLIMATPMIIGYMFQDFM